MKSMSWPFGPLGLIIAATALFAAPANWEGPVLLPISPGHAISMLDGFAVLLMTVGTTWLYRYFWFQRRGLSEVLRLAPGWSSAALFAGGFGLGLLIASAFSSFFWWCAIGATLFGMLMIAVIIAVVRSS